MAVNMIYKSGDQIEIAAAGVASGDPVVVGEITGVALTDTDANGNVVIRRDGVFDLPVLGNDGNAGAAIAVGDPVYLGATGGTLDVDAAGTLFGYALEPVGSGATTTIKVLLK